MKRRVPSSPASLCAIGVLLGAACFSSLAGEQYTVKDINPDGTSFPRLLTAVNGNRNDERE